MTMERLEGSLKPYLEGSSNVQSGLARNLLRAVWAWREVYRDIPLPGQVVPDYPHFPKKDQNVGYIYTSYPEGEIPIGIGHLEIGGKSPKELEAELRQQGIRITFSAEKMLHDPDFTTPKMPKVLHIVRLRVQNLGLKGTPTIGEIYAKAKKQGLDLCPAEVGPHLRLKDTDQPVKEPYYIGIKPITINGFQRIFYLDRTWRGLWLHGGRADSSERWSPSNRLVFSLGKQGC